MVTTVSGVTVYAPVDYPPSGGAGGGGSPDPWSTYERDQPTLDDPLNPPEGPPLPPCSVAQGVATAGATAVKEIKDKPGSRTEYGSVLVQDPNGTIRKTPAVTTGSGDRLEDLRLNKTALGISSFSQIVGFVHNHPPITDGRTGQAQTNEDNRRPSDADWTFFDKLLGNAAIDFGDGSRGLMPQSERPDPSKLTHIVIGPDGVARQYGWFADRDQESADVLDENNPQPRACAG